MNRERKDFWEDNWKPIVAFIYVALIVSFGIVSYAVYTAPQEDEVGKYSISVLVTNEGDGSKLVTVKMESGTVMTEDIVDFEDKTIEPGEDVKFSTETDTSFTNTPYTIIVYRPDAIEDPLVEKDVKLNTGDPDGDITFHVYIS